MNRWRSVSITQFSHLNRGVQKRFQLPNFCLMRLDFLHR